MDCVLDMLLPDDIQAHNTHSMTKYDWCSKDKLMIYVQMNLPKWLQRISSQNKSHSLNILHNSYDKWEKLLSP